MDKQHEPHCPVPRAAARGEGTVCLCKDRRPDLANEIRRALRVLSISGNPNAETPDECIETYEQCIDQAARILEHAVKAYERLA